MKRFLLLVLVFVIAQPLFALCDNAAINITPSRPTTGDDIEVVLTGGCSDGCIPHSPRVSVASGNIIIDLMSSGGCVLVPTPWGERVTVGRVPAGTHTLLVRFNNVEIGRQTLVVRELPFSVKPSFGTEGTTVLIGQREHGPCSLAPCPLPSVTFGGVASPSIRVTEDGDLAVTAPAHAAGLVDIVVTDREGKAVTAQQAFLYPDQQADLTREHERVFYPIAFQGLGANGSDWRTENVIMNRGPIDVATIPLMRADILVGQPMFQPLAAGDRRILDPVSRDGGLFFMVPRGMESWLAYSSHFMDRSRRATDAGTEMRVVHEKEAGAGVTILNVPLTGESRQTLRIYDFDAVDRREVIVTFRIQGRTEPFLTTASLTHRIVCVTTPCYPEHPTYAVLNLDAIPELRGAGIADITLRARTNDALLWAFVSVTNNDTQHVTTYSPQHRRMSVR